MKSGGTGNLPVYRYRELKVIRGFAALCATATNLMSRGKKIVHTSHKSTY